VEARIPDGERGEIIWLHVDPIERGQGVGTELFERMLAKLRERVVEEIQAIVLAQNQEGGEFVERFDFKPSGQREYKFGGEPLRAEIYSNVETEQTKEEEEDTLPESEEIEVDGVTRFIDPKESISGDKAPILLVFEEERRETRFGFYCTNCGSFTDSVDGDGMLRATVEDIAAGFDPELDVEPDEVEAVLHLLQQFEPAGICARDLRECLLLQLRELPADTPWREAAMEVLENHMALLAGRDYATLQRRARLSEADLTAVLTLIQTLNPRPGSSLSAADTEYVVPDVFVTRNKRRWTVELNAEATPRLRIHAEYAALVRRADSSSDNQFLKDNLQEARWFLKSLQSRNETLLKVATCIVEHQRNFLEYGPEAMKPLVLAEIADTIGMHESTISRVTTRKYMHTPRGIFELKYFFSSHVGTASGGEISSTAIRALIRKLTDDENPRKPLSDSRIAQILGEQDIRVARRTIAKYRESMAIPPSNERKRLV
jgi:RNA polymerase sigma-54 factor